jgi:hypothetical protein
MRQMIWLGSIVLASVGTALVTHYVSRSHYLERGASNGNIHARVAVIQAIDAVLPNASACTESEYRDWKEIVAVKSWAVYVKPVDDKTVLICRAR